MSLNLAPLEHYRLRDRAAFQMHCRQPKAIVAGLRTEGNGLVVHRATCIFLQKTIALGDTNLTDWFKYGMYEKDLANFQAEANNAQVPVYFTCRSHECRTLRAVSAMQ